MKKPHKFPSIKTLGKAVLGCRNFSLDEKISAVAEFDILDRSFTVKLNRSVARRPAGDDRISVPFEVTRRSNSRSVAGTILSKAKEIYSMRIVRLSDVRNLVEEFNCGDCQVVSHKATKVSDLVWYVSTVFCFVGKKEWEERTFKVYKDFEGDVRFIQLQS